jgi:hypothetical protein
MHLFLFFSTYQCRVCALRGAEAIRWMANVEKVETLKISACQVVQLRKVLAEVS